MLRWIVVRLSSSQGRTVSFRDAAGILREELEAFQQHSEQIEQARHNLIEALRAETLTAWGKRDARRGEPNPAAQYEAIAGSLFLDDLVSLTDWGTIGADPDHPTAIFNYHGPTFRDVRFYSAEVSKIWPPLTLPSRQGQSASVEARLDRTGAPGRPTSRSLVEREFERRRDAGETLETLIAEARALSAWLGKEYPHYAQMTEKTIANCIRVSYRAQKATKL
jgi:hypothetical protein